ncbi:protein SWOLLEN 1-like isoform X1 [Typha angustifolia]|uniref:protein SWOLLEN 1-like isoform X1 n=1 Tax=Typha angustifolia TaxID=59011 RepID=UPI003C2E726C
MDYDDNDIQNKSFQLSREDNRFPQSVLPFALPKFDIDEHLQHLRSDNLVETEVLFGIQGPESSWIEDFSPGSSAIEFRLGAAESCSLSRHNNVWSEATSSESVEMLLKSVREDEMAGNNDTIVDGDASGCLNVTDRHMDPLLRPNDSSDTLLWAVTDPTIPLDKCQNNLSGSNDVVVRSQPAIEDNFQISSIEKGEAELDVTSLDDQSNAESKSGTKKCITYETLAPSSDETTKRGLAVQVVEVVQGENPLDNTLAEVDDHACVATANMPVGSDAIICRGAKYDPSTLSSDKLDLGSEKFQPVSEKILEVQEIQLSEQPGGFQLDSYQEALTVDTCQDEKVDDHHSRVYKAEDDLCNLKDSSCLDPSLNSLVLLNDAGNNSLSSNNTDGLLESTADPVHTSNKVNENCITARTISDPAETFSKDNKIGDNTGTFTNEISSLVVEGNTNTVNDVKEGNKENGSELFNANDRSEDVSHCQTANNSKNDLYLRNPLSISYNKLPDSGEERENDCFTEDSGEKQDTQCQLSPKKTIGIADSSKMTVDGHSQIHMKHEIENGKKDGNAVTSDPKPANMEKNAENKDAKINPEKSDLPIGASEDVALENCPPALLDETEVNISSTCGLDRLANKPSAELVPCEISAGMEENTALSVNGCNEISLDESCTIVADMECTSYAAESTCAVKSTRDTSKMNQDKPVSYQAAFDAKRPSISSVTTLHQPHPEDTPSVPLFTEQQEATPSSLTLSSCNESFAKNVDITTISSPSGVKKNLDVQISGQVPTTIVDMPSSKKLVQDEAGVALIQYSNTSLQSTLTKSSAATQLVEPESGNLSLVPNCGSPTIISCSKSCQDEIDKRNRGLSDHTGSSLDDLTSSRTDTDKDKSTVQDSKQSATSEDDRSFTFEVGSRADLSERNVRNFWKSSSQGKSSEIAMVPGVSPFLSPSVCISKENPEGHCLDQEETISSGNPHNVKSKQISGCAIEKVGSFKEATEETISKRQMTESKSPSTTSISAYVSENNNMQLKEMQKDPSTDSSDMKASCSPAVQTSSLPDLNSSVSTGSLFRQPFADIQQVQLRAQIFVYGSLIQAVPPEEACMTAAFGESDGGRAIWEGIWHAASEKFQNKKSPLSVAGTPIYSHSVLRTTEHASDSPAKSNSLDSPVILEGSKVMQSTVLSSTVSVSSPSWTIPRCDGLALNMPRGSHLDFNQAISPLHSFQSSYVRQYTGNAAPLFFENPHPVSWVVSSQSSKLEAAAQYSTITVAETAQVLSHKDSSISQASSMQLASPSTLLLNQCSTSVSAASVVQSETEKKAAVTSNPKSTSEKSRRRKKGSGPEKVGSVSDVSRLQPASANPCTMHTPTSSGFILSANSLNKVLPDTGVSQIMKKVIFSEEASCRIDQSKLQAEEAAAHAAAAIRHSQAIWSQLNIQKKSGLISDNEEKLASAAVAAAAAASVAKAAAEAAKVASEAALLAKTMIANAIASAKTEIGQLDVGKNLARLSPVSILKGNDKDHGSSLIISAARAASRRRVEAASAATKRAENLDAILKAAELAAEAVSQAGQIITMGGPLPFTIKDMVEAGPDVYQRAYLSRAEKPAKNNGLQQQETMAVDVSSDKSIKHFDKPLSNHDEVEKFVGHGTSSTIQQSLQLEGNRTDQLGNGVGVSAAIGTLGEDPSADNLKGNSIQKGSLVEVLGDRHSHSGVWFAATCLDVKDGKACVCYRDLSDEGSDQLKEWIPLELESNKAPRIRLAHPIAIAKYEGTRKRRREVVEKYTWAVGDRVDAWIKDGWWEGNITEKSQEDETKYTVHFPARGDSLIVKAWNIRPSLVWKDGRWIEWASARERISQPYEGDSPIKKRQRLDPEIDGRGTGAQSNNKHCDNSRKTEKMRELNLSANDRVFKIGKTARDVNKTNALNVKQRGLQNVGSGVVFGVPKPGKKRKFMEVSKHYVADNTGKMSERNDSIKFAKYLMPQTSRVLRNTSKVDPKGKQADQPKTRNPKSVKSQNIQVRSTDKKESSSSRPVSVLNGGQSGRGGHGSITNTGRSFSNEDTDVEKNKFLDDHSSLNSSRDTLFDVYCMQPGDGVPTSKNPVESEIEAKGKFPPAMSRSTRNEAKASENSGKAISDAVEPRRSNRRIQPTSKLLEGLQSSLIVSKIPSVPHDKSARGLHKGASSLGGSSHG